MPVLIDVDPGTYCIDPEKVEAAITPRTKAIIAVHIAGHPADLDRLKEIARIHNLFLIEDSAHAHGSEWKGHKIGSIGNTITPPEDLRTIEDASAIIYLIVNSICTRLKKHNMKACCISISTKDNQFNTLSRQCRVSDPTDSMNFIFNRAYALFQRHYSFINPLRSVGVRVDNLVSGDYEQYTLFETEETKICVDIDERIQKLTSRFGKLNVEKTSTSKEWS
jgi:hypothetical protein